MITSLTMSLPLEDNVTSIYTCFVLMLHLYTTFSISVLCSVKFITLYVKGTLSHQLVAVDTLII